MKARSIAAAALTANCTTEPCLTVSRSRGRSTSEPNLPPIGQVSSNADMRGGAIGP